jgi:sec-independent protein translocase protein TatA
LVILVIVLIFFGPSKLPGLGSSLGKAIRGFKDGMNDAGQPEQNADGTEKLPGGNAGGNQTAQSTISKEKDPTPKS